MIKKTGICPYCGEKVKSKAIMAKEILEMIGFKGDKSIYNDGTFNATELAAVYCYIKSTIIK